MRATRRPAAGDHLGPPPGQRVRPDGPDWRCLRQV